MLSAHIVVPSQNGLLLVLIVNIQPAFFAGKYVYLILKKEEASKFLGRDFGFIPTSLTRQDFYVHCYHPPT